MSFRDKARERATRVKALGIATLRANKGSIQDIADMAADAYIAGDSFETVMNKVRAQATELATSRYRPRIVAALSRGGIDIAETDTFDVGLVSKIVAERAGVDLEHVELTPDGVLDAIDKLIALQLSHSLKVPFTTVRNTDALKASLDAAVQQALRDGRLEKLILKGASVAARRYATWKRAGIPVKLDQKRIKQRAYQKKYARTHYAAWVPR